MRVKDLMTKDVSAIDRAQMVSEAGWRMWDGDCGALPVVDDENVVVGMITDRDICMATVLSGRPPSAIAVSETMSKVVHACRSDDTLDVAEATMRANQIRRLPVIDEEGKLEGILSLADVARATEQRAGRQKEQAPANVVATLAGICAPRAQATL